MDSSSYKGLGFFYSYLSKQDGYYELIFIPVCGEKEQLISKGQEIQLNQGLSFSANGYEDKLVDIFPKAEIIALRNRIGYPYSLRNIGFMPVYIEFEKLKPDKDHNKAVYNDTLKIDDKTTFKLNYIATQKDINKVIKLNKVVFLEN